MATIVGAGSAEERGVHKVLWEGFTTVSDVGNAHQLARWPDKTVQVFGTFGSGTTTVTLQGSDDGSNWVTLNDPQGNALTISSAKMEAILENPAHIRPKLTAASTDADVDVVIIAHGNL